jgi:GNAT superfamily N-acetyltransferase
MMTPIEKEWHMQIFEFQDTQEQTLLCLNYNFAEDCKSNREVALHDLGNGVNVKRYWNYNRFFKGLHLLIAYEGTTPVGHIEYVPIEHAPRPVRGEDLTFINCMYVQPQARNRGVGSALLKACEEKVRPTSSGLSAIVNADWPPAPYSFFAVHDFITVAEDHGAQLMVKAWAKISSPSFLPRKYESEQPDKPDQVTVDIFWCGQCPHWVQTRDRLTHLAQGYGDAIKIRGINTDDRTTVERWGISDGLYVNGRLRFAAPPSDIDLRIALEQAVKVKVVI